MKTPVTENSQEDHTSSYISKPTLSVNKKKLFILSDSMVKHIEGWDISSNLQNKHKVYVHSFLSAKVKSMKYYSKPCFKEDKPDHLILHVGKMIWRPKTTQKELRNPLSTWQKIW